MDTDSDVIRASLDRPSAFGELYERHARSVHRYAASRAGTTIADDVMSETFLVAFESRNRFDHARHDARPWLFGIATNLLHRHRRAEATRFRSIETSKTLDHSSDAVSRAADRVDAARAVSDLAPTLRRMRSADRDTLLLFAWGDLSYEEIAVAMAVPIGTVRSRLNRARLALRHSLPHSSATKEGNGYGRADTAAPPA